MKFADTSWWVAWVLPDDAHHGDALGMFARVGGEQVLTTNLVVGETWTLLRRRSGHRTAVGFFDRIGKLVSDNKLIVHAVTGNEEMRLGSGCAATMSESTPSLTRRALR